jgi:hypothetical protein
MLRAERYRGIRHEQQKIAGDASALRAVGLGIIAALNAMRQADIRELRQELRLANRRLTEARRRALGSVARLRFHDWRRELSKYWIVWRLVQRVSPFLWERAVELWKLHEGKPLGEVPEALTEEDVKNAEKFSAHNETNGTSQDNSSVDEVLEAEYTVETEPGSDGAYDFMSRYPTQMVLLPLMGVPRQIR